MKTKILPIVAILACAALGVSASVPAKSTNVTPAAKITGEYVEARTASVFAGACHYNGEFVTTGCDAILAWNFTGGTFDGTDLKGVRAMAALTSDANLGEEDAPRKSELVIDSSATPQQAAALTNLLHEKCYKQLGTIVSVRRGPVAFVHDTAGYTVNAAGFASLSVLHSADGSCCIQPHLVWYSPLTPIEHRMVGFTQDAEFSGTIANHWTRQGEDSAFYGDIAL